ncbi:hypothetical protein V8C40DRAFT_78727 [Trichoderma camerunense]
MTTYENTCHPQGAFLWSGIFWLLFFSVSSIVWGYHVFCFLFSLFLLCLYFLSSFPFISYHIYVCFGGVSLKLVRRHGADIGIYIDRKSWTTGRKKGTCHFCIWKLGVSSGQCSVNLIFTMYSNSRPKW